MSTLEQGVVVSIRDEKLEQIKKWLDEVQTLPFHDQRYLFEEVAAGDKRVAELEQVNKNLRSQLEKLVHSDTKLRHMLTLWLALRGSYTEEFFKATIQLGVQSAKVLNE